MSLQIEKRGEIVVIGVEGQLVVANRMELKQTILDQLDDGERRFLIDFRHASYIDSAGLGVLVSISKAVRERGGELRLANLNDDLKTLFQLTKLDTLFPLGDDGDGAAGAGVRAPVRPPPRADGAAEDRPQ